MTLPDTYRPRSPPFTKQREALEAGYGREFFAYLLPMGTGKSKVLIDEFCLLFEAGEVDGLLLLAPKNAYTNWTRRDGTDPGQLQAWLWSGLAERTVTYAWDSARAGTQDAVAARHRLMCPVPAGPRVLAVNVEALSTVAPAVALCYEFLKTYRVMAVIDESTRVASHLGAVRTKELLRMAPRAHYRRILTGRAMGGKPSALYPQFEFLKPGCLGYRTFTAFRARYCTMREISVGNRVVRVETGAQNVDELREVVLKHAFRATKEQCLDLPPKVYTRREVALSADQKRLYGQMRKQAMAQLLGRVMTTQIVMTQVMRLQQIVYGNFRDDDGVETRLEENRSQAVLDVLDECEGQVVVWVKYLADARAVRDAVVRAYGRESLAEWHGGVPMRDRELGELDFKAGRRRTMLASFSAGAEARDWYAATTAVYYGNDGLLARMQSEDRTHRAGTTQSVTYVDLVSSGTVDEKIIQALRSNREVSDAVMGDGPSTWL